MRSEHKKSDIKEITTKSERFTLFQKQTIEPLSPTHFLRNHSTSLPSFYDEEVLEFDRPISSSYFKMEPLREANILEDPSDYFL